MTDFQPHLVEALEPRRLLSAASVDLHAHDAMTGDASDADHTVPTILIEGERKEIFPRIINGLSATVVPRIINGQETNLFPEVAKVGGRSGAFCTGTLITDRHVLTAGHCAERLVNTGMRANFGGTIYATSAIHLHPNYDGEAIRNDLAILELDRPVVGIDPVPLYRKAPKVGQLLTVVGFGEDGNGVDGGDGTFGTKRYGTTKIENVRRKIFGWTFDDNTEINTGNGDSGGPGFIQSNGEMFLAGVTSFGTNQEPVFGESSFESRVDFFAGWIDSVAGTSPPTDPPNPNKVDDHANKPNRDATVVTLASGSAGQADGIIEKKSDRDAFSFDIQGIREVSLEVSSTTPGLNTRVRLYDGDGKLLLKTDKDNALARTEVVSSLTSGTYFVTVESTSQIVGGYDLDINAQPQGPGGAFDDATAIRVNNRGGGKAKAAIDSPTDSDLFTAVAKRDGEIVVDIKGKKKFDTTVQAIDISGIDIVFNDDFKKVNPRVVFDVSAGERFFVEVDSQNNEIGEYTVKIANRKVKNNALAARVPLSAAALLGTTDTDASDDERSVDADDSVVQRVLV